jgi:hypothetical protein
MPVFTTKTSTDPGPFDALHPAGERAAERANRDGFDTLPEGLLADGHGHDGHGHDGHGHERERRYAQRDSQQTPQSATDAPDEDGELDQLYRFQEIPVTAEMRRELLGAKLPLASVEQLADTQPPHKSSLSAPAGPAFVDRHGPTEPALVSPKASRASEPMKHDRPLLERERLLIASDSYSTTAPTLLSVRRRRLRNQRYVIGALAVMILAMVSGVAWRRITRPAAPVALDSVGARTKTPHIAGNRPGSPVPRSASLPPERSAPRERVAASPPAPAIESANSDSQSAQLSSRATDATSSSPLTADSRSASGDSQPGSRRVLPQPVPAAASPTESHATSASGHAPSKRPTGSTDKTAPGGKVEPAKSKAFDPEELIF